MNMTGVGSLQTARDLLGKLERDLARLNANPADIDAAYDCFVLAYDLLDWNFQTQWRATEEPHHTDQPRTPPEYRRTSGEWCETLRGDSLDRVHEVIQIGIGSHGPKNYWSTIAGLTVSGPAPAWR